MPVPIPSPANDLVPAGTTIVRGERMSPAFIKYHLGDDRVRGRGVPRSSSALRIIARQSSTAL